MLKTPTPFPQVGSYALLEEQDGTHLVRIQLLDAGRQATISFPARRGASGNKTVPLDALIDGTPLNAAETAELRKLQTDAAQRRKVARRKELQRRSIYADHLATMLRDMRVPA